LIKTRRRTHSGVQDTLQFRILSAAPRAMPLVPDKVAAAIINAPATLASDHFRAACLAFDLGDLGRLAPRKLLRVSDVFVTHRHMDHFAGFDRLLRVLRREKFPRSQHGHASAHQFVLIGQQISMTALIGKLAAMPILGHSFVTENVTDIVTCFHAAKMRAIRNQRNITATWICQSLTGHHLPSQKLADHGPLHGCQKQLLKTNLKISARAEAIAPDSFATCAKGRTGQGKKKLMVVRVEHMSLLCIWNHCPRKKVLFNDLPLRPLLRIYDWSRFCRHTACIRNAGTRRYRPRVILCVTAEMIVETWSNGNFNQARRMTGAGMLAR
jgi:hypothetical protein